jgi:hypothetical protein
LPEKKKVHPAEEYVRLIAASEWSVEEGEVRVPLLCFGLE